MNKRDTVILIVAIVLLLSASLTVIVSLDNIHLFSNRSSTSSTGGLPEILLDKSFTCYGYSPPSGAVDSCRNSWPLVRYSITVYHGWVVEIRATTSSADLQLSGFVTYGVGVNEGKYGNPPSIHTFTINQGGTYDVDISLAPSSPVLYQQNPSFSGSIAITRLSLERSGLSASTM